VAGIEATVNEWVACLNAGDILRASALETDEFITSSTSSDSLPEELSSDQPTADYQATILDIVYVREFEDGQAGAVILLDSPAEPAPVVPLFLMFKNVGDRWLIDQWPDTGYVESGEWSCYPLDASGTATPCPTMDPVQVVTVISVPTLEFEQAATPAP
jgi:hypothetical protein